MGTHHDGTAVAGRPLATDGLPPDRWKAARLISADKRWFSVCA